MTGLAVAAGAFALALALSVAVERPAARRGAPPPALAALPARAVVLLPVFLFWLGLFRRPLLAGFATLATAAVVTAVSVRKRQLVAEPLTFSDFALLRLVVRHPELYYVGFMARPPFLAAAAAALGLLAAWLWAEPAILGPLPGLALSGASLLAVAGAWALADRPAVARPLRAAAPFPRLERDVGRWGLLLTLGTYALRWRAETRRTPPAPVASAGVAEGRPDLVVVVQLESFADPRRLGLADMALPGLDRARARALAHGTLETPAHGAFTMRTEYAVLTGEEPAESGFRGFDPYLAAGRGAPATLANRLRAQGWRTLFMHPFHASFFGRDRVMGGLGFERARWLGDFPGAETVGPYMSDAALAREVVAEALAAGTEPTLVVAVTMENHGPWPPERLPDEPDATRQYLRHLAGSDRAIDVLLDGLSAHGGRALLCVYGDHPPILPGIDRDAPPRTDYAVLELGRGAGAPAAGEAADLTAAGLGRLLFSLAGLGAPAEARPGPPRAA